MTHSLQHRRLAVLAAAALVGLASGCATLDRQTAGTVGGAVLGGVAGDALFGNTLGTVGGAAAGAYIGNEMTKPKK